ncbi:esterase/lipase family protein [Massilia pseudoviolaceinigra]|uniref:esterase/lipase family protein n=1 Tax=Massilia pseudoviolaceinigra TaxID=3057165 RepID=UPI00279661E4|nr:alpha/beta fold hydrolase [Massilia sp. CCM 9206]MDQ1921000.1 alpha/beta fold hydrolase [Massilia sp. CCM 9206]
MNVTLSTRAMLRWLLLVQAAAACAIALAAMRYGGVASPWLALACGLGAVLLVRLLITANNFVLTARFASATPAPFRIGPGAMLRLFAEEFMATMLQSSWFMAHAVARQRIHAGSTAPPVLLLHGYGCNSGYWAHLTRQLDAARISHASLDLEPVLAGIDDFVPLVQHAADALCEASGAQRVIIVAHSMGGLVARAYLRAHGSARVAHVFTLGTPHHGTSLASKGVGVNASQMRRQASGEAPESAWLRALGASESAATRALITSFYTHHDNIVAPQTSSVLEGARNIAFGGVGHVALCRNRRVLDRLMDEIGKLSTR